MTSGSRFLLAARQCEIAELENLARTGELVAAIGRFIHALQRERGLSIVGMLQEQSRRLQAMGDELDAVRATNLAVRDELRVLRTGAEAHASRAVTTEVQFGL